MAYLHRIFIGALVTAAALVAAAAELQGPPVRMKAASPHVIGKADAPLTMVEFSDYECTFCQQYHARAFGEIKKAFIDTGKLRYVVRDYPLPTHRNSVIAARAARCAGEQGRFWEMRAALLTNVDRLDVDALVGMGRELKLDEEALRACIVSNRFDAAIRKDMQDAAAAGVSSTPTFVIGRSQGDSVEGRRLVGSLTFAEYEAVLESLLAAR